MTGESGRFEPGGPSGHRRPSPDVEAEIHRLTDDLLEHRITDVQRRRLEEIVAADPAAAETYLAIIYEWGSLPSYVGQGSIDISAAELESPADAAQLNETMILPAVRPELLEDDGDPPLVLTPRAVIRPERSLGRLGSVAAVGLLAIAGFVVYRASRPAPSAVTVVTSAPVKTAVPAPVSPPAVEVPPASITAIASLAAGGPSLRQTLSPGRVLTVTDGAVELTFASGAVVVVRAPARIGVVDQNAIGLYDGSLSAHVPAEARGFRVVSPGLMSVDRGTDFGVRTLLSDAGSEVHIFGGIVDVAAANAAGTPVSQAVRAVTGDAFGHDSGSASAPSAVVFSPQSFSRDIAAIRRAIPTHNTGDGLAANQPDPNWILKSAPDELHWTARPAGVIGNPVYSSQPNAPSVKWVSTDGTGPRVPAGIYVFTTTVDLTGFDPATARVQAIVTADDHVTDIRINGVSAGLSTAEATLAADYRQTSLDIPAKYWKDGVNQIEFVVHNADSTEGGPTQMGLQVRWVADGCTRVRR